MERTKHPRLLNELVCHLKTANETKQSDNGKQIGPWTVFDEDVALQ